MNSQSIILLGGPDSGKTNYIGRLWPALDAKRGSLIAAEQPQDIGFVIDTADHLFQGEFAPRTELAAERRNFRINVARASGGDAVAIVVPDISGELWRRAVLEREIPQQWMDELGSASGAMLFVRVASDQNVSPLDWVTSRKLLAKMGQDDDDRAKLPTQVMLCELVRFLELTMVSRSDGRKPRLSIMVTAWDRMSPDEIERGPAAFLEKEFPLFAGRLADLDAIDVRIFAVSVVGGDLKDDMEFRDAFLDSKFDETGWIVYWDAGARQWVRNPDVTLPVEWLISS